MGNYHITYENLLIKEIKATPEEYLPALLNIIRTFRESVMLKPAADSFRTGWKERPCPVKPCHWKTCGKELMQTEGISTLTVRFTSEFKKNHMHWQKDNLWNLKRIQKN